MDGRKAAYTALMRVRRDGSYSNLTLDAVLRESAMDPRDKGLAAALFYGVLERRITLDHVAGSLISKKLSSLDVEVLTAVEMGLYQLLYLSDIPASAAVNESVKLVKAGPKKSGAGFVNGVLRSFIRSGCRIPPAKGKYAAASVETAMPVWILKRWEADYGWETALSAAKACLGRPPLTIRVNPLQTTLPEAVKALEEAGIKATPCPLVPGSIAIEDGGRVPSLPLYQEGKVYVQDLASQLCVLALDPQPGDRVFDLCAAPGSKSFTAAGLMGDEGEIFSFDLYPNRVKLIQSGAARLHLRSVQAQTGDAASFNPALGVAQRVLCDVPCSGLGVIRRKPEIRFKDEADVDALPELQRAILQNAAAYVAPGGILIYSTCTLNRAENDRVVEEFLAKNIDFVPDALPERVARAGQSEGFKLTLFPSPDGPDGFFIARMKRKC